MHSLVLVVTGTRRWSPKLQRIMVDVLQNITNKYENVLLVHGHATGADTIADEWGKEEQWVIWPLPYIGFCGKHGGMLRNVGIAAASIAVANRGKLPLIVCAFPDDQSRGTFGCIKEFSDSNVKVERYDV